MILTREESSAKNFFPASDIHLVNLSLFPLPSPPPFTLKVTHNLLRTQAMTYCEPFPLPAHLTCRPSFMKQQLGKYVPEFIAQLKVGLPFGKPSAGLVNARDDIMIINHKLVTSISVSVNDNK